MTFLPKTYKGEPDTGKYMRFKQGENRFRVLSSAIIGMEYWKETKDGRKPVRYHMGEDAPIKELDVDKEGNKIMPKHFWSFVVFSRDSETIQILQINQRTIRDGISAYVKNDKWGSPLQYDLVISRDGEGMETKYSVIAEPKEELDEGITALYESMDIKLNKLFDGGDPFGQDEVVDEVK